MGCPVLPSGRMTAEPEAQYPQSPRRQTTLRAELCDICVPPGPEMSHGSSDGGAPGLTNGSAAREAPSVVRGSGRTGYRGRTRPGILQRGATGPSTPRPPLPAEVQQASGIVYRGATGAPTRVSPAEARRTSRIVQRGAAGAQHFAAPAPPHESAVALALGERTLLEEREREAVGTADDLGAFGERLLHRLPGKIPPHARAAVARLKGEAELTGAQERPPLRIDRIEMKSSALRQISPDHADRRKAVAQLRGVQRETRLLGIPAVRSGAELPPLGRGCLRAAQHDDSGAQVDRPVKPAPNVGPQQSCGGGIFPSRIAA